MDASNYLPNPHGRVAWDRLGSWDHPYYLPEPIPRTPELDDDTFLAVLVAERELGMLSGSSTNAQDFELLTGTYAILEALASSKIEGTQSTLDQVISNEIARADLQNLDLKEVVNYQAALLLGQELLQDLPVTQRLFLAVQKELLTGVRGQEKTPGELRQSPVWVGQGVGPAEASFIPPLPHHIPELLTDWEHYVNEPTKQVVLWLALSHYQFETIHPLLDGNGRVGRMLIELQLVAQGILPRPALGISSYFQQHRTEYYLRLQDVRERGALNEWISFFANAITERARASRHMLLNYRALRVEFLTKLQQPALVDALLRSPLPTVSRIMTELQVSQPTASKYLAKAEAAGVIEPLRRSGRGGKQQWVVTKAWAILQADQNAGQ